MSALIGALRVSLSAETAQFEAGMKRAQRTAQQTESSFKKSFGGLGNVVKAGLAGAVSGLSVGLLVQGAKAALDYAGSLGEVAQQLGVTTRELQVFRFAVQQNGGTVEQADQALGKFAIAISKALAGSKQATAAFGAMGVSLNDLQNKSKTEVLGQIADQMKATGGASANAAAGVAIFGRGFQKIIPVLDQGSAGFNELAAAADELGIVLSEEQIQNADKTADKLDALMTVLKAKIAGEVADNTDSIFSFIDALFELVRAAEAAREAIVNFQRNYNLPNLLFKGAAFGKGVAGKSVTTDLSSGGSALALAKKMGLKVAGTGSGVSGGGSQFLASGGGGGGRSKRGGGRDDTERKRQEALRAAFQFDQELLRAQQDVLRAQQQLSTDYSERAALSIQMLNLEQQSFAREMEYAVASGDLTKAQAAQLEAEFAKTDELERQAVLAEEETRRKEDYNRLDERDADAKIDLLSRQADLAETAKERLAIELRIIDLAYDEERRRLNRIMQESKDWAEIEAARRDLLDLTRKQAADRQGAMNNNRSPLQDYKARYSDISEENEEAIVGGLEDMAGALSQVTKGWDAMKEAAKNALDSLVQALIRNQINQLFAMLIPSPAGFQAGGLAGFATGGWVSGPGTGKSDSIPAMLSNGEFVVNAKSAKQFMPLLERINEGSFPNLAMGGLPIARVSHGQRVNVSNDNGGRGGGLPPMELHFHGPVSKETMLQAGARVRSAVASANRKGA